MSLEADVGQTVKAAIDDAIENRREYTTNPNMLPETRAMLDKFYAPFN